MPVKFYLSPQANKAGEKINLLDMNGKEYEKVVEDAGGMENTKADAMKLFDEELKK